MYIDILSPQSNGMYNRKLAKITNTITAVYFGELLEVISKVSKKAKFDENGYFTLDRKYMEDRTGISEVDQLDCESVLQQLNIIERDSGDSNLLRANLQVYEQLLLSDEPIKKVKVKLSRSQAALNKQEIIIATMKKCITEADVELAELYDNWVDAVYNAKGFLTKAKIQNFESIINKYTTDKNVKRGLLGIAVDTGWTNADWIINRYNQNNKVKVVTTLPPQQTATELDEDWKF